MTRIEAYRILAKMWKEAEDADQAKALDMAMNDIEFVDLMPKDVVAVVRCKDCQEWKELLLDNLPAGVGDCRCNLMTTDAHFYCASGERRSE